MKGKYSLFLCCALPCLLSAASTLAQDSRVKLKAYSTVKPARDSMGNQISPQDSVSSLATFTYTVTSTRDGNTYTGVMVGQDPYGSNFTPATVTTPIVPLIITVNSVATGVNSNSILSTQSGSTTFNPTVADAACLGKHNNVPLVLFEQSPIFQSANFNFGHTSVGNTQYLDAFQRGNFWQLVGGTDYHTLVNATLLDPINVNIPANDGLAIPGSLFGSCGPLGVVNINTLDSIVVSKLASLGFDTSQFPIFLLYNLVMSVGQPTNLNKCCVLGFHGATGTPIQTYSPIDFDTTGLFGPTIADTSIAAHEVGEWMDDPFGSNPTPAWGHTGQVSGCQNNLEVGDPLTGINIPPVKGANGFTYHLQELAFFSWFYGAPSIAVNSWFSDNNTFTTDAGPVCK